MLIVVIAAGLVFFFAVLNHRQPRSHRRCVRFAIWPKEPNASRLATTPNACRWSDDDLGVLAASFNRMQAGLAERRRLHAAFGTYVDPALAAKLLEQGATMSSLANAAK